MKFDEAEPPRFEDAGPEALRKLVRTHRPELSPEALERIAARFAATHASGVAASNVVGARVGSSFAQFKLGILALAVASGLLLSWRLVHSSTSSTEPDGAPVLAPRLVSSSPSSSSLPQSSPSSNVQALATISVDQLPSVAPSPASAPKAPVKVEGETKTAPVSESEFDIVQRAETALASDPSRALAVTAEHLRAYPSGELVQEREVIAVEALAKLRRPEDASLRARALAERFPNTPYATRLEKALGHPIDRPSFAPARPSTTP